MLNQTWQSDFTHYRLATGVDVEIISCLDDCTRYALHCRTCIRSSWDRASPVALA